MIRASVTISPRGESHLIRAPFYGDEVLPSVVQKKDGGVSAEDNVGGLVQEVLWEIDEDIPFEKSALGGHVHNWIVLMQDGRLLPVFQLSDEYYISSYTFNNW